MALALALALTGLALLTSLQTYHRAENRKSIPFHFLKTTKKNLSIILKTFLPGNVLMVFFKF